MPDNALLDLQEEQLDVLAGPVTPDDDESYGPEPDDPRGTGAYAVPYEVADFDPALEQHGSCCEVVCG